MARAGDPPAPDQLGNIAVACQGRSRPRPPAASSTSPYLASCRRWNDALAGTSPISAPARVAVSGPSRRSRPTRRRRVGWASARRARGSVSRTVRWSSIDRKISFERVRVKLPADLSASLVAVGLVVSVPLERQLDQPFQKLGVADADRLEQFGVDAGGGEAGDGVNLVQHHPILG